MLWEVVRGRVLRLHLPCCLVSIIHCLLFHHCFNLSFLFCSLGIFILKLFKKTFINVTLFVLSSVVLRINYFDAYTVKVK